MGRRAPSSAAPDQIGRVRCRLEPQAGCLEWTGAQLIEPDIAQARGLDDGSCPHYLPEDERAHADRS